jgi:hypothetical protein
MLVGRLGQKAYKHTHALPQREKAMENNSDTQQPRALTTAPPAGVLGTLRGTGGSLGTTWSTSRWLVTSNDFTLIDFKVFARSVSLALASTIADTASAFFNPAK